jgi:hypothetical protein
MLPRMMTMIQKSQTRFEAECEIYSPLRPVSPICAAAASK